MSSGCKTENKKNKRLSRLEQRSRFRELFLAIEEDAEHVDGKHEEQADPEVCLSQAGCYASGEIRENITRA
jgi:hypothetical protein